MCDELSFRSEKTQNGSFNTTEHVDCLGEIEDLLDRSTNCNINTGIASRTQRGCVSRLVESFTVLKLSNCSLALFCQPLHAMDNISAGTNVLNDQDCDSDGGDPFQNCRLSEVVAHMLDSDCDSNSAVNEFEHGDYEIKTAFIDYNQEPRNKELFRDTLRSIDELDLEDKFTGLSEDYVDISSPTQCVGHSHSRSDSNIVFDNSFSIHGQNIRTTVGRSIETVFGVKSPQENEDTKIEDKVRMETEFGPAPELKNAKYRWSVTSV